MKLAIKYCGGCNPRYDRGLIAARLKKDFPALDVGVGAAALQNAELVAVLCGCESRCAGTARLSGRLFVLSHAGAYPELRQWVAGQLQDCQGT